MKPVPDNAATSPEHQRLAELEEEVRRLQRTNGVLMDRVEQRINDEMKTIRQVLRLRLNGIFCCIAEGLLCCRCRHFAPSQVVDAQAC